MGLQLTEEEPRLAKQRYVDAHAPPEIANRLGRNKCTLTRLLVKRLPLAEPPRMSTKIVTFEIPPREALT